MRKNLFPIFAASLFFFVLVESWAAQRGMVGLTASAGALRPVQEALETGVGTGFGFLLPLTSRTRAGVQFLYARWNSLGNPDGLLEGTLTVTPFLLFVQHDVVSTRLFKIHLALGGGLLFSDFRGDFITIPEVTIAQKIPTCPAAHLAAGIAFPIAGSLVLFGQAGIIYCRATGQTTVRDMNFGQTRKEFPANMSSQQALLGLAFYF